MSRRIALEGAIRRAMGKGLGLIAPTPRPEPFFGTRADLLRAFGLGIMNRRLREEHTYVARRKGLSAKSPYARAKGCFPGPARLARATGPGSIGCRDQIRALLAGGEFANAHALATAHDRQMQGMKKPPARLAPWVRVVASQHGVVLS